MKRYTSRDFDFGGATEDLGELSSKLLTSEPDQICRWHHCDVIENKDYQLGGASIVDGKCCWNKRPLSREIT